MMTWSAVDREVNNRFTVVTKYQEFRSEQPYLTIAPTPRTGNLVEEPTDLGYLHEGVTGILINYFYFLATSLHCKSVGGPGAELIEPHPRIGSGCATHRQFLRHTLGTACALM
jgi:hypothetical protein